MIFDIKLEADELITILRALYWYDDKIMNTERDKGRDISERDTVMQLRSRLSKRLEKEALTK
jgi:hypothetical protein